MTTNIYGKYKIETSDDDGRIIVRVYNMNAVKDYNSLVYNYRFHDAKSRNDWIINFVSNVKSREDQKAKRKAERMAFKNPAKVGDVLCASWGYDQTNIDFYQVTAVKGKMVEVKEIGGKSVEGSTYSHGMADSVQVKPNAFIKGSETYKRFVRAGYSGDYYINIDECRMASLTNETEEHYRSWYA